MKIWTDKYAFSVEVKNSGDLIRPEVIVVTSNYRIEDVFPDKNIHAPLMERFRVIHMEHPWNATVDNVLVRENAQAINPKPPVRDLYAERILAKRKVTNVDKEHPPVRRPLFRQNAQGELVTWRNDQTELDQFVIRTEDEVIMIDPEVTNALTPTPK